MAQENADAIAAALLSDLGKPKLETAFGETGPVIDRCFKTAAQLEE
jgi:hypothetical protein